MDLLVVGKAPFYARLNGHQPAGDYDIFLIYADPLTDDASYRANYAHWEKALSRQLNFQVQLRTPGSLLQLYQSAYALRWYDLCQKHQKLWIAPRSERKLIRTNIPALEVSNSLRLLFLCAGTLLSHEQIAMDEFYRLILWICNSVLIASTSYHHTLEGQLQNMYRLQHTLGVNWLRELFYLQQEAVRYRTEPVLSDKELYKPTALLKPFLYHAYLTAFTGIEQQGAHEAFQVLRPVDLRKGFDRLDFFSGSKKQTGWLLYVLPFLMLPLAQWPALSRLRPFISLRLYRRLYPLSPEAQRDVLLIQFLERWQQFRDVLRP